MNIEDIKQKLSRFDSDWEESRECCDMEDFREEVRFLLQELDKVQRENERYKECLDTEFAFEQNWEMVDVSRNDGFINKVPTWKWGLQPWKLAQRALNPDEN